MNKKSTLLAAGLMIIGSFAAKAIEPGASNDFYYLKNGDVCLTLGGFKDSVVVKAIDETKMTKASLDSALWQIVDKQTTLGVTTYSIRNKATSQYLAFAPAKNSAAEPVTKLVSVANGVSHRWIFSDTDLRSFYSNDKYLSLSVEDEKLLLKDSKEGKPLSIVAPSQKFTLTAEQLGAGFRTFKLNFADTYIGNIFADKDLVAKDVKGKAGYVTLQAKGDESYPNGVAKYFGVDTLKTEISGAQNAFGYKFSLDSTRTTLKPNAAWQQFKFTIDLKNDSLAMFAAATPFGSDTAQVVVASVGTTKVLTVSEVDADGKFQGAAPSITLAKGTSATIPTGAGVYFLKSASKGANGGKYYVTKNTFMGGDSIPTVNLPRGQWLIATEGGKYSVVDRQSNSALIMNQEIFEVQGMKDTYLFGGDSVTVIQQPVDLKNKYLGSLAFTPQELVDNGFYLTLIPGTTGVNDLYAYTTDSILKGSPNDVKNASIFKLIAVGTSPVAGAMELGDTISVISYNLRGLFNTETIAAQNDSLKFSKKDNALSFRFISDPTSQKYTMVTTVEGEVMNVGMNINTSCLQLTKNVAYVNLLPTEAPEYASFDNGHKRLTYNNNSLVMNPNTLLAEMKIEGNDIATKAGYEADNFSLWVEKAEELVDGKQLYLISSANPKVNATTDRFYLAANDTLGEIRAVFAYNDTIKTAKGSHALFAFKTAEDGGFYLENQSELAKTAESKPYVGMVNGFAVMQATPTAAFEVESASAPVANENITEAATVRLIGSVGEFTIQNAAGKKITISNILGQTIGTRYISSDYVTVPTARGVIIVSVEGDKAYKVIVK